MIAPVPVHCFSITFTKFLATDLKPILMLSKDITKNFHHCNVNKR